MLHMCLISVAEGPSVVHGTNLIGLFCIWCVFRMDGLLLETSLDVSDTDSTCHSASVLDPRHLPCLRTDMRGSCSQESWFVNGQDPCIFNRPYFSSWDLSIGFQRPRA